ncbi:hypothetical protein [Bradyrhizobium sp. 144]|uniref:hypothetical protein n=1 Tax=Bradyrhizobium sp. 144 TaxID=2782620 RepID=UPI001FFBFFF5|nr:hypothetical protein [Bradyrhizobium sp. 144]MCK1694201.1 hypothetical protein [Bradyrhizobium sp. 144]
MANQYKTRTKTSARAELSTRTATSRPKLAKTDVKRSPPVKDTKQQSAGVGMLALFRDLWMTFKHKVNFDSGDGGAAEYKGTYEVMRSMSFIRPVTAMEALAQAVFIQNEIHRRPQAHAAPEPTSENNAAGQTIPCPGGDGFSPAPRGISKIPDTDTTNRSARSFSAPLRALQFEGPPVHAGGPAVLRARTDCDLINLRLFQACIYKRNTQK